MSGLTHCLAGVSAPPFAALIRPRGRPGRTVGQALGHYAEVGLGATGEALSEQASGTVMAASAGGKAIAALL